MRRLQRLQMVPRAALPAIVIIAMAGCAGEGDSAIGSDPGGEVAAGRVTIITPMHGVHIDGDQISVALAASPPVSETSDGGAHYHLFLNEDPTTSDVVDGVVAGVGLEDGESAYVFTAVSPGEYRLIALLTDASHSILPTVAADTTVFQVNAR